MASVNPSKFPPKTTAELLGAEAAGEYRPVPYEAVAGDSAVNLFTGDREWSEVEGRAVPSQEPTRITVHIGDENLVAIIADLRGRLDALESA